MRIRETETILIDVPFEDGSPDSEMTPRSWRSLQSVLVRITTEDGLTGWGECFGYFSGHAVKAMLDHTVLPLLMQMEVEDPEEVSESLQRRLALFGRYGITIFALSGVDIALWDLRARRQDLSLAALLGGTVSELPVYASLVRYADPELAARKTSHAVSEGWKRLKLHEISRPAIAACAAHTAGLELMIDTNGAWSEEQATEILPFLLDHGASWLEEPVFPPEDYGALQRIRAAAEGQIRIAAGENLCTHWQFAEMLGRRAVDVAQPSVTKVGGLSETLKVLRHLEGEEAAIMPHSPYFGAGFLATLHLATILPGAPLIEWLYVTPQAQVFPDMPHPKDGTIKVPEGLGLGCRPDMELVERYRVPSSPSHITY